MTGRNAFDGDLAVWAIYDHPRDFPDHFVARRWVIREGAAHPIATNDQRAALTLDAVRGLLPPGLIRLDRGPVDDVTIVETWQ